MPTTATAGVAGKIEATVTALTPWAGYPAAADAAVKAVFEEVAGALVRGEAVQLVGFGVFAAKHCPARTGRNPRTGAPIAVPASRAVSFRAGKGLRDAVNRKTG